ncbi:MULTISPECIES: MlaC/ttg2D family ABC transporter substrate-binding protein [Acidithiobacillus]|jgi:phospholipid transport system substrate-binding protein|uniref:Toluene tolerance protein, putative n=3 Tax=root TaxID=1 RepID=B7J3Q7_ACIF2|nr:MULTISPECIES: ABC transporter substrate-binding protein [Acidithiobacillus]EGQ61501.1 toluene tolerance protein, putative [Acidithiobacillus sp. GGI-221]ACH82594.1 toluene tolerance family protein [Acidithiobacillus ferrooxidans ATCC 53993]ACK77842.1 toluene tolerance protein, putative [Acidithiobacillus ferrooxidans ATCC 23270]MBN6744795.1 ABC transporter substrate-binding protein [Acidithiobacillus sp. MC2.2]MBN6747751.1 ABC transporter substrate-binding protein [Acidithiobacillus sp. PG0
MRQISFVALLVVLLTWTLPAAAEDTQGAVTVVQQLTNSVLKVLRSNEGKPITPSVKKEVADIVLPHMDFTTMSQYVMAQYWRQMSPAQQQEFVALFKDLLVRTYSNSLNHYHGQTVRITGSQQISQNPPVAQVNMVIRQNGGGPDVPVIYALLYTNNTWRIYNTYIDGVSMVLNYRQSFGQIAASRGIPALLQDMKAKDDVGGAPDKRAAAA